MCLNLCGLCGLCLGLADHVAAMNTRLLYRILYEIFFTILNIVLLGLLIITPADAIRQALDNNQLYNVFVIAGAYFVTVVLAILIYASRLWTSNTVLKAIPKTYIPVEKGDVGENVRKMIAGGLNRSAAIAWDSRPRVDSPLTTVISEPETKDPIARASEPKKEGKRHGILHKHRPQAEKDEQTVEIPPHRPVWGEIEHNGWSSPLSPDFPNLEYISVILELPHLIEARAVSLAPSDPESTSDPPLPDIRAVDVLQRPLSMGLRDYVGHLISVEVITSPSTATDFLAAYEYARFSGQPLNEAQFRDLMRLFTELLHSMQPLNPALLADLDIYQESDIDDDNSSSTTPRSRSTVSIYSSSTRSGSEGTIRTALSRPVGRSRTSTTRTFSEFSAAPATPSSRKRVNLRSASGNSFAQSSKHYAGSGASSESLQSSSQGSVIRLNPSHEEGELPYILTIPRAP